MRSWALSTVRHLRARRDDGQARRHESATPARPGHARDPIDHACELVRAIRCRDRRAGFVARDPRITRDGEATLTADRPVTAAMLHRMNVSRRARSASKPAPAENAYT
jgi:hypothetical protein